MSKLRFLCADGVWRERSIAASAWAVTGPVGNGTSTALEALFYVVGLNKGDVAVMPPVKALKELEARCTIGGVSWSISRTTAGNTVVFREAGGTSRRVEAFSATGRSGKRTAGDFLLELLGIADARRGTARLGLPQLARAMYLQEATIATHYLGGLGAEERKLLFDVLLGLRDQELQRLEDEHTAAESAYSKTSRLLSQLLKQRKERDLDEPEVIIAEQERKQAQLKEARGRLEAQKKKLSDIAAQRGRLDLALQQARQAEKAARAACDLAGREVTATEADLADTRGYLRGLKRRSAQRDSCSECRKPLPERPEGHCRQCAQPGEGRTGPAVEELAEAAARIEAATLVAKLRRGQQAEAALLARQASDATQEAERARDRHDRDVWQPQHQCVLEAETLVGGLDGELVQLKWRLKEVENILDLTAEKETLGKQRTQARETLTVAQHERETRRKERIQLWSQHFLARVQTVLPGVERARIDPDAYTTVIGHTVFEDSSVAGGERILRNVCALLALRDVAREVPSAPIPSLLVVDFPVYGSDTNETDRHTGTRLLGQLVDAARDGHGQVLLAARALPPSTHDRVRCLALSPTHHFFDHAPRSSDQDG
ncbi:hypothetical protein [Streptomyces sp. SM10]|uniref:hypothetical protein n=1 Tax=Streptomyces sp. SM10 TaxID=565556 RepID=UPI0015E1686A|nr:hypothetical protein [Streptomyces sp. SM10]